MFETLCVSSTANVDLGFLLLGTSNSADTESCIADALI